MLRQQLTAIVASAITLSLILVASPAPVSSLLSSTHPVTSTSSTSTSTSSRIRLDSSRIYANSNNNANGNLTPLPKDISPFDKSASKGRDVQGEIRKLATLALERALSQDQKPTLLELEFPPLIGGEQSKSQFDDFDSTYGVVLNSTVQSMYFSIVFFV